MMKSFNQILLDADSIVYKIGWACENIRYSYKGKLFENKRLAEQAWAEDGSSPSFPIIQVSEPESKGVVKSTLLTFIESKLNQFQSFDPHLFIGEGKSFRYSIATRLPYKGNRKKNYLPSHFDYIRSLIEKMYTTIKSRELFESDDEIAWRAGEGNLIISIDKDLVQIPGSHYNFDTDSFLTIDSFKGAKVLLASMLVGDTADNILGLAGIGPKSKYVNNVLDAETIEEAFSIVVSLYQTHYGCYAFQFLRENFMLLRLLRERPTEEEQFIMNKLNIRNGYWNEGD